MGAYTLVTSFVYTGTCAGITVARNMGHLYYRHTYCTAAIVAPGMNFNTYLDVQLKLGTRCINNVAVLQKAKHID